MVIEAEASAIEADEELNIASDLTIFEPVGGKVTTDEFGEYSITIDGTTPANIVKIGCPVTIISHPKDTSVGANKTAYFSVEATTTTSPSELKYLWQYKYEGDTPWTDWTTKTTPRIGIAYNANKNGMLVRCKVTDVNGKTAISNSAVLTYKEDSKVTITTQPKNTSVAANKTAYFNVEATTTATNKELKYLWQYKYAGESTWTDWTTKTTAKIGIAYNANKNGMSVRCKVTDVNGKTATSNAAVLTYKEDSKVTITTQPKDTSVAANKTAYFSVEATTTASNKSLKYLWQYKYAGESTWTDWTTKTTAKIGIAYNANKNGMSVRCKVTDVNGKTATSNAAVLTYKADSKVTITKQPKDTTVVVNKTAYFSVEATTTAASSELTYLWQYKYAGESSWTDWTTKTTAKIGIAYNANKNGMSVRCKVTDVNGKTATSNEAVLTYKEDSKVTITTQPKNTSVAANKSAYFSVAATTTASNKELKYLWQYKYAGESSWTDWTTKTTAEIGIAYNANKNGMSVRCKVTDANGKTATSNAAVLTYKGESVVIITTQPKDTTVAANKSAYFSVEATTTASNTELKYLWQYKYAGESTWTDWTTKTTAKIGIAYNANKNGMSVRCKVTDVNGNTATSNSAVLSYIGSD